MAEGTRHKAQGTHHHVGTFHLTADTDAVPPYLFTSGRDIQCIIHVRGAGVVDGG